MNAWKRLHVIALFCVGAGLGSLADANADQVKPDEAPIRAAAEAFVRAFNAHDAKAVSALFLTEAKVITEAGEIIDGRKQIEKNFADLFAAQKQAKIEVTVGSILFIGGELAVEAGWTKTTPAPGETPEYGRYTALHVKRDGQWLLAIVRDAEGEPPAAHDRLEPLAWLVGEWVDESPDAVVHTSCRWSADGNFLLQDIRVQFAGKPALDVTQRIGWDPLSKRVRSWVFDSEGGFAEGVWARDGEVWIVKSTGVRPDGKPASATNRFARFGKDAYLWQSTDRVIGDAVQPPIEVKVVRKPPAAGAK